MIESLGSGGAERQLVGLAAQLDRRRFAPRVLTFREGEFFGNQLADAGVPRYMVRRTGRWDPRPLAKLISWLRDGDVKLIHGFLPTGNAYSVLAKMAARKGVVITTERSSYRYTLSGISRCYVPWSFRRSDLVIANSRAGCEEVRRATGLGQEKVIYLPNSIETVRFQPPTADERADARRRLGWSEDELSVLVVASVKKAKNPLGLVSALSKVGETRVPIRVYWAGSLESSLDFHATANLAEKLGVTPTKLSFLGQRSDVALLYRACDIVLLYSSWEGAPNVVLEAQASGCPVVATDVSDVRDYVVPRETGWLVQPADDEGLAHSLREVARTDRATLARMGAEARRRLVALGRSPETMVQQVERIYERVLSLPHEPAADVTTEARIEGARARTDG